MTPAEDPENAEFQSVSYLESLCKLNYNLHLQPSSLDSESHAKIAQNIKDRSKKNTKYFIK